MRKNFFYITMVILVWFVATQNTIAQTKLYDLSHNGLSVDFSPDGKYLATGDGGGDVELWEASNGENIYRHSIGGAIRGIAFSPDGKFIVADGVNGRANVIRLRTSDGKEVQRTNIIDDAKSINAVAYSPDDIHVAIGDDTGRAYLWNVNRDEWKGWRYSRVDELYAVTFSPDGEYLATGDSAGYARIWEVDNWWGDAEDLNIQNIKLGGNVRALTFSPNGRYLAADQYEDDSGDESVYIYDVVKDGVVQQIDQGSTIGRGVTALAFSPDGRFLAVGNVDAEIKIYRIGTEVITNVTVIKHATTIQASGSVEDLAWSPDSNLISDGKSVWRTDQSVSDNEPEIRLTLPDDFISEIAFGPDSTYFTLNAQFPILTGVADKDVKYKKCIITLDLPDVPDYALSDTLFPAIEEYFRQIANFTSWLLPESLEGLAEYIGFDIDRSLFFPDQPPYFMLPLQTIEEKLLVLEDEANTARFFQVAGFIPVVGDIVAFGKPEIDRLIEINEIFQSALDPRIVLNPDLFPDSNDTLLRWNSGRPDNRKRYIMLFPKHVGKIKIKVEQDYVLRDTPLTSETLMDTFTWDLEDSTFSAPHMQPIALSDYPPFQLLPPEVQASLLHHFSTYMDTATWRIPEETSLLANYPNPFNPETWIPYQLSKAADVTLTIYDIQGRVVRDLDLGHQHAGMYHNRSRAAYWDGKNALGESVASGVYFYTLTAGDFTATRKMLIKK